MSVPPIDATSYNRFLLTAGIALLVLAVAVPSVLLQVASEPLISDQERRELSEPSVDTLERREHMLGQAFSAAWWLSAALAGAGGAALLVGALRLRRRQAVSDRVEDLELQDLEWRASRPDEMEERLRTEVAETASEQLEESGFPDASSDLSGPDEAAYREGLQTLLSEYRSVEKLVRDKLAEAFGEERVHSEPAIDTATGPSYADLVIDAPEGDFVVEIKHQTVPSTTSALGRARQLFSFVQTFERIRRRPAEGLLLYVLAPSLAQSSSREGFERRLRSRSFEGWDPKLRRQVSVIVLGRDEIEAMHPATLRSLVIGAGQPAR